MGVGVGVHPARDGACLYDSQRHPLLWLRDGTHPLATRTREPRPLAQARRIRPAAPVGATNLGPADRSYPRTARSASAESEVRPDPGHRPYARITPEPRRQGRSTIHILPADYLRLLDADVAAGLGTDHPVLSDSSSAYCQFQ